MSEIPARVPALRRLRDQRGLELVVLFNLVAFGVARMTGFARETVIADVFGTSHASDGYVAAIALPELVAGMFVGGLVGYAVIPKLAAFRRDGDVRRAEELIGATLRQIVIWCGAAALVGTVAAPAALSIAAPGLHGTARDDAVTVLRITSVSMVLYGLIGLASAMLNTRRRFLPVPVSIAVGNLAGLALLVATAHTIGISAAAVSYVLAALVTALIQWRLVLKTGGLEARAVFTPNPQTGAVVRTAGIAVVIVGLPYARLVVERAMASTQHGGDVASLGFATRTLFVVAALIAVPVGSVLFPRFAEQAAHAAHAALLRTAGGGALLTAAISIPATLLLVVFARDVVALLFQHGAFGRHATATTASILRIYALALPAICLTEVVLRVAFVMEMRRTALFSTVGTFALDVVVSLALLGRIGVEAVAVGAVVGIWLNVLLLGGWLLYRLHHSIGTFSFQGAVTPR